MERSRLSEVEDKCLYYDVSKWTLLISMFSLKDAIFSLQVVLIWKKMYGCIPEKYSEVREESSIRAQWKYRIMLNIGRHDAIPDSRSTLICVGMFTLIMFSRGCPLFLAIKNSKKCGTVSKYFLQSSQRSANKHATTLGSSTCTLRRILHSDLKVLPMRWWWCRNSFRMIFKNRPTCSPKQLKFNPKNVFFSDLSGYVNKQIMR